MSLMGILAALGVGALVRTTLPGCVRMLVQGGLTRRNYRGRLIPVSTGFFPVVVASLATAGLGSLGNPLGYITALCTLVATSIGLLDDVAGDRRSSGLRGHLAALFRGEVSTGALKALIIPAVAILAAFSLRRGVWWGLGDAVLIALAANTINLLDVRPGRGLKGVFFLLLLVAIFGLAPPWSEVWLVLVAAAVVYAPYDFRGEVMLGDSGANGFGFAAGLLCVLALPPAVRLLLLGTLTTLHVVSERFSLSSLIERTPWLDALDKWGRG